MKCEHLLIIDGQEQIVISEVIDKKIWFKMGEQTHSYDLVELNQSAHVKNKTFSKSPDRIVAPMPGKITKVFVSAGQRVTKGDALIVMEAMKMEYTLKADLTAEVEKLNVQINEQVSLGHLLVQLKASV